MTIVFSYHSTSALWAELRSILFRIAVTEHCSFSLLSLFTSALVGGQAEYFHVFVGVTALAESDVLLSSPAGVHSCVADVRLFSVLRCSEFDLSKAYLAYFRTRHVGWKMRVLSSDSST